MVSGLLPRRANARNSSTSTVTGSRGSDNERVGKVDEVLGSDAEDIFYDLRVALADRHRDVMVSADDVASMSVDEVRTSLTRSDIEALPTYDDEATYHLASVGWLRKHLGWKKDATSDEEPG